jgi:hypothetical protein
VWHPGLESVMPLLYNGAADQYFTMGLQTGSLQWACRRFETLPAKVCWLGCGSLFLYRWEGRWCCVHRYPVIGPSSISWTVSLGEPVPSDGSAAWYFAMGLLPEYFTVCQQIGLVTGWRVISSPYHGIRTRILRFNKRTTKTLSKQVGDWWTLLTKRCGGTFDDFDSFVVLRHI